MRRFLFVCVAIAASFFLHPTAQAQVKLGYFDESKLLPYMPGVKKVDTLLALFQQDTLNYQYDTLYVNYKKADSLYRKDSASLSPADRTLRETRLTRYKGQLLYWNNYTEQRLRMKEAEFMYPFKKSLSDALMEVISENGYTLVVNTSQLSPYATPPLLDNLTIRTAMKLGISLSKSVMDEWNKAVAKEATRSAGKPAPGKTGAKPKK